MRATTRLRQLLRQDGIVLAGGAHDALSARIVEQAGYPLCTLSAAAFCLTRGFPNVGLVTMKEMADNAAYVAAAVDIPVIADADTGFGPPINVARTVFEFERAGVAGVHIEDQVWPNRGGHNEGKAVIDTVDMCRKIRAACDARRDPDFVIIARCDALMVTGLADTLARGEAYAAAGADMLFFEMREDLDEIRAMAQRFAHRVPLHFNHSASGKVPMLSIDEIGALGFKTAAFYLHPIMAACKAMREVLDEIKRSGNGLTAAQRMVSFAEFQELGGLGRIRRQEARYAAMPADASSDGAVAQDESKHR